MYSNELKLQGLINYTILAGKTEQAVFIYISTRKLYRPLSIDSMLE